MAKNEIPKISDFQSLGLCDGFAKVLTTTTLNIEEIAAQTADKTHYGTMTIQGEEAVFCSRPAN